jgi:iron(III) transport system permease protein
MEVLNDYGLVKYFGVDTFTTGIFNAWLSFGNINAALKLSAYLMIFVLALFLLERYQRGKMKYAMPQTAKHIAAKRQGGVKAFLIMLYISLPVLFGFLFPLAMLIYWTTLVFDDVINPQFFTLIRNSFVLAGLAALSVVALAVFIAFTVRTLPRRIIKLLARFTTLGYALPGAVVAIGVLVCMLWLDSKMMSLGGEVLKISISGTWFALIYAYVVRFMAVGYNSIESGNENISLNLDQASRSLGASKLKTLLRINLPLARSSVLAAALLVFIDVLKELPLTLILRPFNFDTLAIRAFEYASDERLAEAAPAAVIIVLVGIIPVFILNKMMRQ